MPNWKKLVVSGSDASLNSLNVNNAVTASAFRSTNGVGTPTLTSANNIILSASNAIIIKDASLRLEGFTNAQTSSLSPFDGEIIYNTSRERILLYTGSQWQQVLLAGDATDVILSNGIVSSSAQINELGFLTASIEGIISSSKQITDYGFISQSADGFPYTGSAVITGSLNVIGPITGSSFSGDGSGLTGLSFAQTATVKATFTSSLNETVYHGFNSRNVLISVYDFNYDQVIPARIRLTNDDNVNVQFAEVTSGHIVIAKGGHIVSGTQEVSEIATFADSFTNSTSYTATHNFGSTNVIVSVYDENNYQIIPQSIQLVNANTATITFSSPKNGSIVVAKGGHIVSSSVDNAANLANLPGTHYLDYNNFSNVPSNIVSSSAQITGLGTLTISGSLLPSTTEVFDLGSNSNRWRDLYLSGSTIYLDTTKISRTLAGDLELKDHTNNRKNLVVNELHIGQVGHTSLVLAQHSGSLFVHQSGSSEAIVLANTASYATTASYALNAGAGAGFPFTGSAGIQGSLNVTGNVIGNTFIGDGSQLTGIAAGGGVVQSATVLDTFSNVTSHTAAHNFNTKNVLVQVFNNNDSVIIPSSITTINNNNVTITFPEPVSGRVIVAKGGHLISGSGGGGSGTSSGMLMHSQTLSTDFTIPDNNNAHLIGPVGLNMTLDIGTNSVLSILQN
jgi:hypothetical protein|tara:strand:- start:1747 stop:3780 length:2034 start_codon:yes stop_codon:yes gene_type:complete